MAKFFVPSYQNMKTLYFRLFLDFVGFFREVSNIKIGNTFSFFEKHLYLLKKMLQNVKTRRRQILPFLEF